MNTSIIVGALALALSPACAAFAQTPAKNQDGDLFVWNRPTSLANAINRPLSITQFTTCRFKKSMAVTAPKGVPDASPSPQYIYYSISDEDESDTVSFADLDTRTPKLESNGGQSRLVVISDDEDKVVLVNVGNERPPAAIEVYTIFRKKGVVIYSQQKDSVLIGPFGNLAMGYCR